MAASKAKRAPAKKKSEPSVDSSERAIPSGERVPFILTITINDKTESVETYDLASAAFEMTGFGKITTKALIRIEHGGKSTERWLYPFRARRLFTNKLFAAIFFKQQLCVLE